MALRTINSLLAASMLAGGVGAAEYPSRPIRVVVPFSAGSGSDVLARMIAPKLSESWRQQVVIDNRPSAGGTVAGGIVAASAPDGHTLMITSSAFAGAAALYDKLPYDPLRDFAGITMIGVTHLVLVTAPNGPKTVKELIALAQQKPGQINYGSPGIGSGTHYAGELLKLAAKIDIVHVPYKGAPPAMVDLLAGQVALTFATAPSAVPHVKAGKLRALGVSTAQRITALPDVPTIAEAGVPGFEASGANGLVGPAGVPPAIVERLSSAVIRIVKEPAMSKYLSDQGADPLPMAPPEYGAYIKAEVVKWAKVVKASGAKVD
jgi:tripartite-type tricarboxylate transporter receptor subunit TctC